ncbi:MAG: glycosyltransferase family 2 protein [Burkholderiales bacterium]
MLSVVVNFFNNRREARNTLHSLTAAYQRGADSHAYEVIAVDNGSAEPLSQEEVRAFGPQFRYRFVNTTSVSPAAAINAACRDANAEQLLVIIDGAHILTPGVLELATKAFKAFATPFIATVPFHLGPKHQYDSMLEGYNQQVEDAVLASLGWRDNGYRLFSASAAFADASEGWFGMLFESGCFGLRKSDFLALGGLDERFQSRGGGLVNLDFFRRAQSREDLDYVVLLGEGSFHQFHGGVATNTRREQQPWAEFDKEYARIRGEPYRRLPRAPVLLGSISREATHVAQYSSAKGFALWEQLRR